MIVTITTNQKNQEYPPIMVDTPMSLMEFVKMHVDMETEGQVVGKPCVDGFVVSDVDVVVDGSIT